MEFPKELPQEAPTEMEQEFKKKSRKLFSVIFFSFVVSIGIFVLCSSTGPLASSYIGAPQHLVNVLLSTVSHLRIVIKTW